MELADFTDASVENTEQEVEVTNEAPAETVEAKTDAESTEEKVIDETQEEVEKLAEAYEPDFTYKIKDDVKEMPEFLRGAIKSKEHEEAVRDYLTKAEGLEGIKESRERVESEFSTFREQLAPTIQKFTQFDNAVAIGDMKTAFELADIKPEAVIDSLLMDESTSEIMMKKMYEALGVEGEGSQSLAAKREAHQQAIQSKTLEMRNQSLESQLAETRVNQYHEALDFQLAQNAELINSYDSVKGAGKFREFLTKYGNAEWSNGRQLSPSELISEVSSFLNLAPTQTPQVENQEVSIEQQLEAQGIKMPQEKKATIPSLGSGSNSSVVGKTASTWDEYTKSMGSW